MLVEDLRGIICRGRVSDCRGRESARRLESACRGRESAFRVFYSSYLGRDITYKGRESANKDLRVL